MCMKSEDDATHNLSRNTSESTDMCGDRDKESNLRAEGVTISDSVDSSVEMRTEGSGGVSAVYDPREAASDVDGAVDPLRGAGGGATVAEEERGTGSVQRMLLFPQSNVSRKSAVVQDGAGGRTGDEDMTGAAGGAGGMAPEISLSSTREDEDTASGVSGGGDEGGGGGEEGRGEGVRETAIETQASTSRLKDLRDSPPSSATPVAPEDRVGLGAIRDADADTITAAATPPVVTPPSGLSLGAESKRRGSLARKAADMVEHLLDEDVSEEEGGNAQDTES